MRVLLHLCLCSHLGVGTADESKTGTTPGPSPGITHMELWALADVLRRLKRAHWPFFWPKSDDRRAGFVAACGEEMTPVSRRTQAFRKDLRRAVLATEMLLTLYTAAGGIARCRMGEGLCWSALGGHKHTNTSTQAHRPESMMGCLVCRPKQVYWGPCVRDSTWIVFA